MYRACENFCVVIPAKAGIQKNFGYRLDDPKDAPNFRWNDRNADLSFLEKYTDRITKLELNVRTNFLWLVDELVVNEQIELSNH